MGLRTTQQFQRLFKQLQPRALQTRASEVALALQDVKNVAAALPQSSIRRPDLEILQQFERFVPDVDSNLTPGRLFGVKVVTS